MVLKLSLCILTTLLAASTVNAAITYCNSTLPCPANSICSVSPQCKTGYCTCDFNNGFKDDGTGTCVQPTKLVGDSCTKNSDCFGAYTTCLTTCKCLAATYKVNSDKKDCTPPTPQPLDAYCNTTLTCTATTMCNASNLCQCAYGYKRISGNNAFCTPITINDTCQTSDCGPDGPFNVYCNNNKATCDSGRFACKAGYTWMTAARNNVLVDGCYDSTKLKDLNEKCSLVTDMCKSNYVCSICPEAPLSDPTCLRAPVQSTPPPPPPPDGNNALKLCNATQPCPANMICLKSSQCKLGTCSCDYTNGYEDDGTGGCVKPTKLVGDSCTKNSDCFGVYTTCSTTCKCLMATYKVNSDKKDCTPSTPQPLDAYCNTTLTCSATAMCNASNLCQCYYGYKRISGNNVDCVPLTLNDICQTSDCGPAGAYNIYCNYNRATCDSGKFACKPGYTWMTAGDAVIMDGCYDSTKLKDLNAKCSLTNGDTCKSNYVCSMCPETPMSDLTCLYAPAQYNASNRIISSVIMMIFSAISAILFRSV